MSIHCRTCSEPIYNLNPRNLFKHENEDIRYNIETLTGITLSHYLHLPNHICSACYLDLNHAIAFRDRCLETHKQLMDVQSRKQTLSTKYRQPDPLNGPKPSCVISELKETIDYLEDINEEPRKAIQPKIERKQSHLSPRVRIMRCHDPKENRRKKSPETVLNSVSSPPCPSARFVAIQPAISIALKPAKPIVRSKPHPNLQHTALSVKVSRENATPRKPRITPLEKKYVCDQCGWSFRDLSNMKDHALRHSGVKKFDCNDCGRKFFTRPLLMLHVRVHHKGEKPFVCKYCGMGFRNSPSRCRHERKYHAHQLPYGCKQCSRTFISKIGLDKHKILHTTGEEIHSCNTCKKAFKAAASLKNHYLTKFHLRRVNQLENNNFDVLDTVSDEEEIDFDFPNSMIEEIHE